MRLLRCFYHAWAFDLTGKRPSTGSPTGAHNGVPSARAAVPRRKPAVPPSATARTIAGPRCCCTSATSGGPRSHSIATASLIAGSTAPPKERSTTEPWTAATRPEVEANTSGSTEADIVLDIQRVLFYRRVDPAQGGGRMRL